MQPQGELNPGGLAGQLLYGVLIGIGRKCFIARKLLTCWRLRRRLRADWSRNLKNGADAAIRPRIWGSYRSQRKSRSQSLRAQHLAGTDDSAIAPPNRRREASQITAKRFSSLLR